MFRCLLLLLLLAAPALAQTTTTTLAPPNCIDRSAADFLAATAGDIDFQTTILLVGKRHFDVSVPQNVVLCTQGANSIYYASYPNLREGQPALAKIEIAVSVRFRRLGVEHYIMIRHPVRIGPSADHAGPDGAKHDELGNEDDEGEQDDSERRARVHGGAFRGKDPSRGIRTAIPSIAPPGRRSAGLPRFESLVASGPR